MTWAETYEQLVYQIEAIFTDRKEGPSYVKEAMLIITDLESIDELGIEAAVYLLPKIKSFHDFILNYFYIEEDRRLLIYHINEFTERYKGDLTSFVNNIPWVDGCVPYYWAQVSGQSRFDVSSWMICEDLESPSTEENPSENPS